MTLAVDGARARAVLLDIEGTTTPLEFVRDVLFPYARAHVEGYLQAQPQSPVVLGDLAALRREHTSDVSQGLSPPAWQGDSQLESATAYVHWLMDRDRKSTTLKSIQGRIWQVGYRSGELQGQVYPDVPPAFLRWAESQRKIGIFSSGSVLAQRLLFESTPNGDLTRFITGYFDTATGPKVKYESYALIADLMSLHTSEALFVSDTPAELEAAQGAGMQVLLCARSRKSQQGNDDYSIVETFDPILPCR